MGCDPPICQPGFGNCNGQSFDCETSIDVGGSTCTPKYRGTITRAPSGAYFASAAIAPDGSYFVGGDFNQAFDFDPTGVVDVRTPTGSYDAFVTKYNSDGTYAWSRFFGSDQEDSVVRLVAGPDGSIVAAAYTQGEIDFGSGPVKGAFLVKFGPDGAFKWAYGLAGSNIGDAAPVAVDGEASVLVFTNSQSPGDGRASISKLSSSGALVWSRVLAIGNCKARLYTLGIGAGNAVWGAGVYSGDCPFDPAAPRVIDGSRAWIVALESAGDNRREWTLGANVDFPGNDPPQVNATAIAIAGEAIYVGGSFDHETDFDPGPGVVMRTPAPWDDNRLPNVYVLKLSPQGSYAWVQTFAGPGVYPILATAPDGGVLSTTRTPMGGPPGRGFVITKINANQSPGWTIAAGGEATDLQAIASGQSFFILAGIQFPASPAADYDPSSAIDVVSSPLPLSFLSRYAF